MVTRRKFQRPLGERRYRKLFVIAVEGTKTEPQYFALFNEQDLVLQVKCLKGGNKTSPPQVLRRMEDYLKQERLLPSDEAWLVVDKDSWTDEQLRLLTLWAQKNKNYGFALSNPNFEYWLLLHFEDGAGITSAEACNERLHRYLRDYDKGVDARRITRKSIDDAIGRAKKRDTPPCADWPRQMGRTTVYRLVEKLLKG